MFFFSSAKSDFFLKKFIFFEKSDEKNEIGVDPAEKRQKVYFLICNRFVGAFWNFFHRFFKFFAQFSKSTRLKTLSRAKSERGGPGGQPPPRQSASRSLVRIQDRTMSLSDDGSRQRPHPRQHPRRRLQCHWPFGIASGTLSHTTAVCIPAPPGRGR